MAGIRHAVKHVHVNIQRGPLTTFCDKKFERPGISVNVPAYCNILCVEPLIDGKVPDNPAWCPDCINSMKDDVTTYQKFLFNLVKPS